MKEITVKKLLILLAFCTSLGAQEKAKPVDVEVKQVNDRRTNGFFAQLAISLELPKVKWSDVAASRVLVASATDDSGRSLLDPDAREPQLEANASLGMSGDDEPRPATVSVTLKNPDRKATTVKEVRGEIELYMPSKDPNSVAEIAKFKTLAGKPLAHKALKANSVEISLLTNAQLETERKKLGEAKRKELAASGWEGESLEQYVSGYLESLLRVEESDVILRVKDPGKRIQEISYVDANGEVKRASMRDDEGLTILSTWGEPPQADWKLRVSMKTPKNLVRHTFALDNVPLP
jgi:hypothetical protein